MNARKWFYSTDRKTTAGPIHEDELKSLFDKGQVSLETLVWAPEMAAWAPMKDVEALAFATALVPPPLPPALEVAVVAGERSDLPSPLAILTETPPQPEYQEDEYNENGSLREAFGTIAVVSGGVLLAIGIASYVEDGSPVGMAPGFFLVLAGGGLVTWKRWHDPVAPGIGGWLLLPAIAMVLGPARIAADLLIAIPVLRNSTLFNSATPGAAGSSRDILLLLDLTLWLAWLVFLIAVGRSFFRKRRRTVNLAMVLLVLQPVLLEVDALLLGWALPESGAEPWRKVIGAAVVAGIWIPYFLKSRRVKNTFAN